MHDKYFIYVQDKQIVNIFIENNSNVICISLINMYLMDIKVE